MKWSYCSLQATTGAAAAAAAVAPATTTASDSSLLLPNPKKYITHNTSTSPPKPSHTEMSRKHSDPAGKKGGNERARAFEDSTAATNQGANGGAQVYPHISSGY